MSTKRFARAAALVAAMVLALGACSSGPGGGPANDPTSSVSNALTAMSGGGGLSKVAEFACAAHKNDVANAFGGGNTAQLEAAGIKAEDLFNAMTLTFSNVSTKEVSKSGNNAVVHVTADMKISFDKEKFKALMKTVLAAQGQPTDDATIDRVLSMMGNQLEQTQHIDEDIDVVNEGGKWLICE